MNETTATQVRTRIIAQMERDSISRLELSRRVASTPAQITGWLNNGPLTRNAVVRIAKALGVPVEALTGESGVAAPASAPGAIAPVDHTACAAKIRELEEEVIRLKGELADATLDAAKLQRAMAKLEGQIDWLRRSADEAKG